MIYNPLDLNKSYLPIPFDSIGSYDGFVCEKGYYMINKFNIAYVEFIVNIPDKGYMATISNGTIVRQCSSLGAAPSYDTLKYMREYHDMDIVFVIESDNKNLLSRIKLLI